MSNVTRECVETWAARPQLDLGIRPEEQSEVCMVANLVIVAPQKQWNRFQKKGPCTQRDMGGIGSVIQLLLFCISIWNLHVFPVKVGKKDGKLFTFRYMGCMLTWQRYKSDGISEALASTSCDKTVYTVLLMYSEVEATSPNAHKSTLHICLYCTGFCRINAVINVLQGRKKK